MKFDIVFQFALFIRLDLDTYYDNSFLKPVYSILWLGGLDGVGHFKTILIFFEKMHA